MWKDLTLKEKAEIMKMSVANGVTDINDIQKLYNDSIRHRFDEGGVVEQPIDETQGYTGQTPTGGGEKLGNDTWLHWWLPQRQEQFEANRKATEYTGYDGTTKNSGYTMEEELDNLANTRIYNSNDPEAEVMDKQNPYATAYNSPFTNDAYGPYIYMRYPDDAGAEATQIHEMTHALNNTDYDRNPNANSRSPQEVMIDKILEEEGIDPNGGWGHLYQMLNDLRFSNNVSPDRVFTDQDEDEIRHWNWSNNAQGGLGKLPTSVIIRLLNEIAYEPVVYNTQGAYAALGGHLYNNGSYFGKVLPELEVIGTRPNRPNKNWRNYQSQRIRDRWFNSIMPTYWDTVGKPMEYILQPFERTYGWLKDTQPDLYNQLLYSTLGPEFMSYNNRNDRLFNFTNGGHLYKNAGPLWSHSPASMIEHFEGFRESPYRDGTAWSVGYGQYKNGYGANLDWDALLSGKKKLTKSEAHQQVLRTVADLKKKLKNTLGEKLYNSLTPGQLMGYLDTGYQRPASMISAAKVHKNKGAAAAASVLGVNGFADRNAARRAAFTGNWDNYTERGNREYTPNKSTGDNYVRQMLNNYEAPAFQPITLSSANISSPWMDYISKISQQPAVSFNTPIGPTNTKRSNSIITKPVSLNTPKYISNTRPEVMQSVAQLPQYQSILNSALFNDPYLLFRNA